MARPGTRTIAHTWIPMPDGIRLAARIWLPEDAGAAPDPAVGRDHVLALDSDARGVTLPGAAAGRARAVRRSCGHPGRAAG